MTMMIPVIAACLSACGPDQNTPYAAAVGEQAWPSPAAAQLAPGDGPLVAGVQTHFSQGWPASSITMAKDVNATMLRDSVPWGGGEKTVGAYDFSGTAASRLASACAAGMTLILTAIPENPLYDGGRTVFSAEGMAAYAAYVDALIGRFGKCVAAIEVGNEINGSSALKYPAGTDAAAAYVSLLKVLRDRIKPKYPDVAILGGSTNMIGTGFLERLFAAGMLPLVDGVAVHPYRSQAHSVDLEVANLQSVMRAYGQPVEIWATEFSHDVPDPAFAAGELIKMVALMSASGVDRISWYALLDQTSFPTMGLYASTTLKPQGRAYRFAQQMLIPKGRPVRVDMGDPLFNAWRYPDGTIVAWGTPRQVTLAGTPRLYSSQGAQIPSASQITIGFDPVTIVGGSIQSAGTSTIVADTLTGYGTPQWTYFARTSDGVYRSLTMVNDSYTSYLSGRYYKPLRINMGSAAPAGTGTNPIRAIMRYTSPVAQSVDLWGCFAKTQTGDGVDYAVLRNGQSVAGGLLTTKAEIRQLRLDLQAGDKVELAFGPNLTTSGDAFGYRAMLYKQGTGSAVACP